MLPELAFWILCCQDADFRVHTDGFHDSIGSEVTWIVQQSWSQATLCVHVRCDIHLRSFSSEELACGDHVFIADLACFNSSLSLLLECEGLVSLPQSLEVWLLIDRILNHVWVYDLILLNNFRCHLSQGIVFFLE